jgi:hypothetical protein
VVAVEPLLDREHNQWLRTGSPRERRRFDRQRIAGEDGLCSAPHLPVRDREQQPTVAPPMLLTSGAVPDGEAWTPEVNETAAVRSFATTAALSRSARPTGANAQKSARAGADRRRAWQAWGDARR